MHSMMLLTTAAFILAAPAAAPGQGRAVLPPAASAASTPVSFTITGAFKDESPASRVFEVESSADSDGDGVKDGGFLRVRCGDGAVVSSSYQPRDSASGLATGKRMHKPFTITKEMRISSPAVGKAVSWDLKEAKGARTSGGGGGGGISATDDWMDVTLRASQSGLCT